MVVHAEKEKVITTVGVRGGFVRERCHEKRKELVQRMKATTYYSQIYAEMCECVFVSIKTSGSGCTTYECIPRVTAYSGERGRA